jgi:2-polyprenyl-6-methoxyphenol hydroxylase-like FAD-dependent oxidoreductase
MAPVLIIGGGIAGVASALALQKAGLEAAVYEAHPDSSQDGGAFLTLASNGMRALQQIDAAAVVAEAGSPLTTMRVCNGTGTEVATVPLGDHQDPATRYRYLTRAGLCAALHQEAQRRGIPIQRGKRLTRVIQHRSGVTADFSDGTRAAGEILIGADGLNSTVRPLIDPTAPAPRYVGQRVFYGYSRNTGVRSDPDCFQVIRGAAAFGYIVTQQQDTWWFARVADDELHRHDLTSGTTTRWRAELSALLQPEPTPAAGIVEAAHRVLVTNAYDLADVPTWRRTRMIVIGDAAHAASPATGQGASMALEDAVVLAKALRDQPDPASAFTTYEQLRRERVQANITASARRSVPDPIKRRTASRPPRSPGTPDEALTAQLDWHVPLAPPSRTRGA